MRSEIVEAVYKALEEGPRSVRCACLNMAADCTPGPCTACCEAAARAVLRAAVETVKADICPGCARGDFITATGWHYTDLDAAVGGQGGVPCEAWPIMRLSRDLAAGGNDGE